MSLKTVSLETSIVPKHIAIIMDGNGRWAQSRGLPRTVGHKKGVDAVRRTIESCVSFGVECLTLFGFSSENWARPEAEVSELMKLLRYYLRSETAELHNKGVRLRVIGDRERLDHDIVELIEHAEQLTSGNSKFTLIVALNYGGRQDIVQAAMKLAQMGDENLAGFGLDELETLFSKQLMTKDFPDPDLLIRTSGEQRISNFLLWQCAYAEMVFLPVLWPDFGAKDLKAAIEEFASRDRRFGGVTSTKATK